MENMDKPLGGNDCREMKKEDVAKFNDRFVGGGCCGGHGGVLETDKSLVDGLEDLLKWAFGRDIAKECWQNSEDHGFHQDPTVTFGDRCTLLHSEVSEAFEEFRLHKDTSKLEVQTEIADVIIRCFDMAGVYGWDIAAVVRAKMEYNKTRPFMHGKKL